MNAFDHYPVLNKDSLIGGCMRLPLEIDAERLQAEIAGIPTELWSTRGGRVGVHSQVNAIFFRGYAPAEGDKPIEDREILQTLPYVREILAMIPANPLRCLAASLKAEGVVAEHSDIGPYFQKTIRLHFPVTTNPQVTMFSNGMAYKMKPGEVWALNNIAPHRVLNEHKTSRRIHIICDFLPEESLLELLSKGQRDLGKATT